jgi:hypothetical protein
VRRYARGPHSNVVVNLKAEEAVALAEILRDAWTTDPVAITAVVKVLEAGERAQIPWIER